MSINDIERQTKAYATARQAVADIVTELNDGIEALKRQHMRPLKAAVNRMAEHHEKLKALIEQNPGLFERPRTTIFHGIKVGFQKGKGGLSWEDDNAICRAIRKSLPDQADILIITTEEPSKTALAQLDATQLKKLGVTVAGAGDQVVIKSTDSEIDKLVKALTKGATEEAEGAAS